MDYYRQLRTAKGKEQATKDWAPRGSSGYLREIAHRYLQNQQPKLCRQPDEFKTQMGQSQITPSGSDYLKSMRS